MKVKTLLIAISGKWRLFGYQYLESEERAYSLAFNFRILLSGKLSLSRIKSGKWSLSVYCNPESDNFPDKNTRKVIAFWILLPGKWHEKTTLSQITPWIRGKTQKSFWMRIRGLGTTDSWKNQSSKISCYCPFNVQKVGNILVVFFLRQYFLDWRGRIPATPMGDQGPKAATPPNPPPPGVVPSWGPQKWGQGRCYPALNWEVQPASRPSARSRRWPPGRMWI